MTLSEKALEEYDAFARTALRDIPYESWRRVVGLSEDTLRKDQLECYRQGRPYRQRKPDR